MKIKMLECRSGADGVNLVGDIIDINAEEAGRMIQAGQAELCTETVKKPQKAIAVKNTPKKKFK